MTKFNLITFGLLTLISISVFALRVNIINNSNSEVSLELKASEYYGGEEEFTTQITVLRGRKTTYNFTGVEPNIFGALRQVDYNSLEVNVLSPISISQSFAGISQLAKEVLVQEVNVIFTGQAPNISLSMEEIKPGRMILE